MGNLSRDVLFRMPARDVYSRSPALTNLMHGQVPATIPNCLSPCIHPLFITDQTLTFTCIMHVHTRRAILNSVLCHVLVSPLKYQSRSCGKRDKHDCKNSHVVIISFLFTLPYVNLRLKYVWFSGYPTDNPSPPLPFNHFKGFPSSAI